MPVNEIEKALTLLSERMERLEKQNGQIIRRNARIAWVLGAALLLAALSLVVSYGRTHEIVRTKALQIVDEDGSTCVTLGILGGLPCLTISNKDRTCLLLAGSSLVFFGEDGNGSTLSDTGLLVLDEDGTMALLSDTGLFVSDGENRVTIDATGLSHIP